ncbi:uberolysin/carnocyclin family circular bacteriocin [Bacillus pumilus]|uniref:uberolysin/carnocyclin family circular bacteriocin n=1 Tax=Bacillus pumilus TaxID=1408 RepID=UPI0024920DFC|nr:uberolysin/carnocyclin family circular bacteriocin [Bacillus pumilus]MDM5321785.1 uberolysin/carnocyclin family circular bacteriocin [Bacillus pumilus]MDR4994766.1 uberolysin/carnocyclin family circular bacteriocin [Bacillus altitudinis]
MTKATDSKFYALLSLSLLAVTLVALVIGNGSLIAANLGVSSGTAFAMVNFLDAWSSVATVITVVGMFTGVGTISAGVAATILAILKKKGKAKAAAF